jgi:hypothetical protein
MLNGEKDEQGNIIYRWDAREKVSHRVERITALIAPHWVPLKRSGCECECTRGSVLLY